MDAINKKNEKVIPSHPEKVKTRSWILFFIFFVLVFILVIYYFTQIKKEFKLLERVNVYWLIMAILAQVITYFLTAFIYRTLLATYRLQQLPGLSDLLKASVISQFFNQTVPSAQVSGNTFIFNFLVKFRVSVLQIISTILAELLIFYAAMEVVILLFIIISLWLYKVPGIFLGTLTAGIAVYFVFGTLIVFAGRKEFIKNLYKRIKKIKIIKKLLANINQSMEQTGIEKKEVSLTLLKKNQKTVLKVLIYQIMLIASDGLTVYALFHGLGVHVAPYTVLLGLVCTKIISIIPFLPGALILYESSMSFFFLSLGVPPGSAIIVTLLYRLLSFWFPIPIGLLLYRRWIQKTPKFETGNPILNS